MKIQSGKAKGRRLQQFVCSALLDIGAKFGLEAGDIASCSMGANGLDVILSPLARRIFGPLAIECKNRETLNVTTIFEEHARKYPDSVPMVVHKRNFSERLVTLRLSDFLHIFNRSLAHEAASTREAVSDSRPA